MKETKEVVFFVVELVNAFGKSLEDDQVTLQDAMHFWVPLTTLAEAVNGIDKVKDEIKGLSQDDVKKIAADSKDRLNIPQEKIEDIVEIAIDIGTKMLAMAAKIRE